MKTFKKFLKSIGKKCFFTPISKIYRSYRIFTKLYKLYPRIIFLTELKEENNFINIHCFNSSKNKLSELCEKYGSDKGYLNYDLITPYGWKAHTYANLYYKLFNHCKDEIKLIFECGIGATNSNILSNMTSDGKPGASLRV